MNSRRNSYRATPTTITFTQSVKPFISVNSERDYFLLIFCLQEQKKLQHIFNMGVLVAKDDFLVELDCEVCEEVNFFGINGTCDEEQGKCLCPEGFSGRDDWMAFGDCIVKESIQMRFHKV